GADVAHQHERRGPLPGPALVDVGAASLLADGDEREPAHHPPDFLVLPGRVEPDFQPGRPGHPCRLRRRIMEDRQSAHRAIMSRANTSPNRARTTLATSARAGRFPSTRSMDVTPPSVIPHGTIPRKKGSGSSVTFNANP